jgi:hypothetical protein
MFFVCSNCSFLSGTLLNSGPHTYYEDALPLNPCPLALFILIIFGVGSHNSAQASLDCDPPRYAPCGAEMVSTHHIPSYWLRWGSC